MNHGMGLRVCLLQIRGGGRNSWRKKRWREGGKTISRLTSSLIARNVGKVADIHFLKRKTVGMELEFCF